MPDPAPPAPAPRRLFDLRSGGWVLILAALVMVGTAAWSVQFIVRGLRNPPIGDGHNAASYRYDLTNLAVPADLLVGSGMPRDGKPTLERPELLTLAQYEQRRAENRRDKYLVPSDRVIGLVIGTHARAYPLSMMNVHEVVHDTVDGVPVAITYSPPCDSAVVFDRRMDGRALDLRFSGLLYNSNLVLYDREAPPEKPSLWSQLSGRAISGPAATRGAVLASLPCQVTTWSDWTAQHPQTQVMVRPPHEKQRYDQPVMPRQYYETDLLIYPVQPLPPSRDPQYKTRCLVVTAGGERRVYPLPWLAKQAGTSDVYTTTQGTATLTFRVDGERGVASVTAEPPEALRGLLHTYWFAWHAQFPDDRLP